MRLIAALVILCSMVSFDRSEDAAIWVDNTLTLKQAIAVAYGSKYPHLVRIPCGVFSSDGFPYVPPGVSVVGSGHCTVLYVKPWVQAND